MINAKRVRHGLLLTMLSAMSVIPAVSGCSTTISDSAITRISTTDASRRHASDNTLFIDARPRSAFRQGHIAGAISLRLGDLSYTERDRRLMSHAPLVIYGENPGSGPALALAKRLLDLEYKGIVFYEPGLAGWRSAGLPVDQPDD